MLIMDSYHDLGEDYGKTIAGIFAVQRFVERVFGEQHGMAAHLLWNWYGWLPKKVVQNRTKDGKKGLEGIVLGDVVSDMKQKGFFLSMVSHSYRYNQQTVLRNLGERIDRRGRMIQSQEGLPESDKQYALQYLARLKEKVAHVMDDVIPYRTIKSKSGQLLEQSLEILDPRNQLNAKLLEQRGMNVVNGVKMRLYREGYLKGMTVTESPAGLLVVLDARNVKRLDGAGNIRIIGTDKDDRRRTQYTKAEARQEVLNPQYEESLATDGKITVEAALSARAMHRFHVEQYLYRIVADMNRFSGEADTNYKDKLAWITRRFHYAASMLGSDFLAEFERGMEQHPLRLAMEPPVAETLLPVFKKMCTELPSNIRPKTPYQEMWDSLFSIFSQRTPTDRGEPSLALKGRLRYA
jgi:hypothetical protein